MTLWHKGFCLLPGIPLRQHRWSGARLKILSPLATAFCRKMIAFAQSNSSSAILDRVSRFMSGLQKHDRIFANDNLIYFATQRLPATRWSHFDPDLQNKYEIQMQMVHELQQNAPPYIALDSEFDSVREPNDSSKSSGVMLLDNYIQQEYQPSETFGTMSVWRRRIQ